MFEPEVIKTGLWLITMTASLALDKGAGSMNLYELVLAGAGGAMQPVDVLGDDHFNFTGLFELDDGVVDRVRLGVTVFLPQLELIVPVFHARLFAIHEVLIINRLTRGPDSASAAKGRNTTWRRDTSAREDEDTFGFAQMVGESFGH